MRFYQIILSIIGISQAININSQWQLNNGLYISKGVMVKQMDAFAKSGVKSHWDAAEEISRYLKLNLPKVNTLQVFKDAFKPNFLNQSSWAPANHTKNKTSGNVTVTFSKDVED